MTDPQSTDLQEIKEIISHLEQIIQEVDLRREFKIALDELIRWKRKAIDTLSKISKNDASKLENAGDFTTVSQGEFEALKLEAERHRKVLSRLADELTRLSKDDSAGIDIRKDEPGVIPPPPATKESIKIFVSYSHQDADLLAKDSLLGYLEGLEREGVEFWRDENLVAGDMWDDEIKQRIKDTNIALVLVSEWFLNSAYCTDEISGFLKECRERGLIIFPIIISPCEWKRHEWLKSRQFIPSDDKTVREDFFVDRGKREALFLKVKKDLRKQIEKIRESKRK